MRKFLGTLVIVLLVIAVVGFFRGWLSLSSDDAEGKTKLEISIDKTQLKDDTSKLKDGARDLVDRISGGSGEAADSEAGDVSSELDLSDSIPEL